MRFSGSFLPCVMMMAVVLCVGAGDAVAKGKAAPKKSAGASDVAQSKADWQVGMIRDDKGAFNYCMMRAEFNNDLSLAFALSPKQEINIGIGVPNAGFAKEEKHQMKVAIDKAYSKDAVAVAANPELLLLPMHQDKELVAALREGKSIALTGKEDATKFALKGMAKAWQRLQTCVDVGTGKVKMPPEAAAKLGDKKGAAKGKQASPSEFPPGLKGLLVKAGFKDLEIVSIPDPEHAPVDFGWKTHGLFGGMRERAVPADATIEKMSGIMEAGYKKQCTGTFTINKGAVEHYSGVDVLTMNVACDMKEHKAYVALLIYLTDNHLFTMFMHEGESSNKDAANKARDSIATLIRQLAREQPPAKSAGGSPAEAKPVAQDPVKEPSAEAPTVKP